MTLINVHYCFLPYLDPLCKIRSIINIIPCLITYNFSKSFMHRKIKYHAVYNFSKLLYTKKQTKFAENTTTTYFVFIKFNLLIPSIGTH